MNWTEADDDGTGSGRFGYLGGSNWVLLADLFVGLSLFFFVFATGMVPMIMGAPNKCEHSVKNLKKSLPADFLIVGSDDKRFSYDEPRQRHTSALVINSTLPEFAAGEDNFTNDVHKGQWEEMCTKLAHEARKSSNMGLLVSIRGLTTPQWCGLGDTFYAKGGMGEGLNVSTADKVKIKAGSNALDAGLKNLDLSRPIDAIYLDLKSGELRILETLDFEFIQQEMYRRNILLAARRAQTVREICVDAAKKVGQPLLIQFEAAPARVCQSDLLTCAPNLNDQQKAQLTELQVKHSGAKPGVSIVLKPEPCN